MFARRVGGHRGVAIARDAVEIAAIVAAGVWAVYTFIYVEHVKPAGETPAVTMTGSLHRMGERNGLIQFAWNAVVHNVGQTRIYFIAESFTVTGEIYTTQGTPYTFAQGATTEYERSGRIARIVPIFRETELSRYVDPKYHISIFLDPGEQATFSGDFLVRHDDADVIVLWGGAAFTKSPRLHPTKILYTPEGAVYFSPIGDDSDYHSFLSARDRTTLW